MIWTIAKKEILISLQTFRFGVSALLCLVLIPTSLFVFGKRYQHHVAVYEENRRVHRQEAEMLPHTWARMMFGIRQDRPPERLGIFASGLDDQMTGSYKVGYYDVVKGGEGPSYKNPILSLFPKPDLLSIFTIVGSLLALLFLYDVVCGERVDRTLPLALSNAVPRRSLLVGQLIGNYIVLVLPFLIGILAGLPILTLLMGLSFSASEWLRIGGIVLSGIVYLGVFCGVGLLISVVSRTPDTALVISLLVWCLVVILLPGISTMASKVFVPPPSAETMEAEKTYLAQEFDAKERERLGHWRIVKKPGVRMRTRVNPLGTEEGRRTLLSRLGRREKEFERRAAKSERMVRVLSRLSPAASLLHLGSGLAHTGGPDLERLRGYWWTYRGHLLDFYEEKIRRLGDDQKPSSARDIPDPRFPGWEASLWLHHTWPDMVLMVFWGAIVLMGAVALFNRSEVV